MFIKYGLSRFTAWVISYCSSVIYNCQLFVKHRPCETWMDKYCWGLSWRSSYALLWASWERVLYYLDWYMSKIQVLPIQRRRTFFERGQNRHPVWFYGEVVQNMSIWHSLGKLREFSVCDRIKHKNRRKNELDLLTFTKGKISLIWYLNGLILFDFENKNSSGILRSISFTSYQ